MDKWMYTILNTAFFLPVIFLFWFGIYRKIFFKRIKFIFISALIGVAYFFIVDIFATAWGAWKFDYSKTLDIRIGNSVIEELIWVVLVFVTVALMVEVLYEKYASKTL